MSQAKSLIVAILCIASGSAGAESLTPASTTSTDQSGLFAYLLPLFKQAKGLDVKVVAAGTGQDFVSRRDKSGARSAEIRYWTTAGPASQRGGGDRECGCGMGRAEHGHRLESMRADR